MTNLSQPLTPWTREQSLAVVTAQIEANRSADADRLSVRDAQIVTAVAAGTPLETVAYHHDMTATNVRKIVRREAPELLTRHTSLLSERNESIIAAIEGGASYQEAALRFGMTVDAVRQVLARHAPQLMVSRRMAA